jgi:hypothetical protein
MEFSEFLLWKFFGLLALVFVVHMVYRAVTGKSIEQVRRDIEAGRRDG